jgi:hypothetical protein
MKVNAFYPSDYHRQINRLELEGDGKFYPFVNKEKLQESKPNQYYMKCEMPFFLVVNPNGHKCFISDCPNVARQEANRLNKELTK